MANERMPVWRLYRIEGRKAVIVTTLKAPDEQSALAGFFDARRITEAQEKARFFARIDE